MHLNILSKKKIFTYKVISTLTTYICGLSTTLKFFKLKTEFHVSVEKYLIYHFCLKEYIIVPLNQN